MNKKQILESLKNDVYCKIKKSHIDGIGVFAIKSIPEGTNPFRGCVVKRWYGFKESELRCLDPPVRKMVHDFFDVQEGKTWIPDLGLNGINIFFFLNSSKKPNLRAIETKDDFMFIASRDIKAGEELTVDYSTYDERSRKS